MNKPFWPPEVWLEAGPEAAERMRTCNHDRTVLDRTGGPHLTNGEYWDDISDRVICLDCDAVLDSDNPTEIDQEAAANWQAQFPATEPGELPL